ncbi:MAG: protein jag, partial [Oscillospiraceae bacterium]|nr:protein jag [Oscillospiraceae bacterium]
DVDIQVLEMGTPGLFGLFGKPAKVKLTVKEKAAALDLEMPVFSLDQSSGKRKEKQPKAEKTEKPEKKEEKQPKAEKKEEKKPEPKAEPAEEVTETAEAEETAGEQPKPEKKRRNRRKSDKKPAAETAETAADAEEAQAAPSIMTEPFVATPEEELTEETKSARAFLQGLTEKMGVPAQIEVSQSEEQLRMVLSGENMSILIGRRGETLDALQYLTSLNVNRGREDYLRVSLDTENYRAKREEALRKLAVRMAGRCKKSGRRVALEPMNPYERRILHSALQADPDVTTHSEGEEPYRRVIITLK